ncbi:hypothetical protein [Shinella sp.]|uniref:hypothetical protein n=1 Tax=Shinella sp. TaxID=1870904 RepID=UPI002586F65E|nr:hypothetical protein [Shinella sp.]MCO5136271.1 hypothetical protein [Shinella sp.]
MTDSMTDILGAAAAGIAFATRAGPSRAETAPMNDTTTTTSHAVEAAGLRRPFAPRRRSTRRCSSAFYQQVMGLLRSSRSSKCRAKRSALPAGRF